MTKEEKVQLVQELVSTFQQYPNFYIADTGGMTVADVNELRRACFNASIKIQVVKNTLVKKALEQMGDDYSEAYPALKQTSALMFTNEENASLPAKVLKEYRTGDRKLPVLKAAVIDRSVFFGDDKLDSLTKLKTKAQLVGEVIGLLQSPARNVISALQSGGQTIAGLVKALEERAA